jgi:[calcium/calmodulin-dependent protein kinase] kinase
MTGNTSSSSKRASLTLLKPPATIISPPSPTDIKTTHPTVLPSPPRSASPPIEYDSPESASGSESDHFARPPARKERRIPRPRSDTNAPSDNLEPIPHPVAADQLSNSPQPAQSLLQPDTPGPSKSRSRSPSPSSPHYRPRPPQHRRLSSTHRVRETMDGETRNTETGDRMVNQYKIGRPLGRGAYATVESAIDVGSGIEYVSRCTSCARTHIRLGHEGVFKIPTPYTSLAAET